MDENNITQEDLQELGYTDSQIGSVGELPGGSEDGNNTHVLSVEEMPSQNHGDLDPGTENKNQDPEVQAPQSLASQDPGAEPSPEQSAPAPTAEELAEQVQAISRKEAEDYNVVQQDIFKKLFKDVDAKVRGAQGEEISDAQELLNYTNPVTGEPYTAEEAAAWFNQAKSQKTAEARQAVQTSEALAKVNYSVDKGAEKVRSKYAEALKADPVLAKKIYDGYVSTLKIDPGTGIIMEAPVSIVEYYDNALSGFASVKSQEQAYKTQIDEMKQVVEDYKKQLEEVKSKQSLADRSDVFGADNSGGQSKDAEDFDKTVKEYYKEQGFNL